MSDSEFEVDHNKCNFNGLVYVRKPRVIDQDYSIALGWSISQSFGAVEGWVGGFDCFTSFATVKVISKTGHRKEAEHIFAPDGIRTRDLLVRSQRRSPLSYPVPLWSSRRKIGEREGRLGHESVGKGGSNVRYIYTDYITL